MPKAGRLGRGIFEDASRWACDIGQCSFVLLRIPPGYTTIQKHALPPINPLVLLFLAAILGVALMLAALYVLWWMLWPKKPPAPVPLSIASGESAPDTKT
jgi:hypothetical protein